MNHRILFDWAGGLQSKVPFAVIGSEKEHDVGGKKVRGRKYPWGIIEGTRQAPRVPILRAIC